jgi:hypothetical protein
VRFASRRALESGANVSDVPLHATFARWSLVAWPTPDATVSGAGELGGRGIGGSTGG